MKTITIFARRRETGSRLQLDIKVNENLTSVGIRSIAVPHLRKEFPGWEYGHWIEKETVA